MRAYTRKFTDSRSLAFNNAYRFIKMNILVSKFLREGAKTKLVTR